MQCFSSVHGHIISSQTAEVPPVRYSTRVEQLNKYSISAMGQIHYRLSVWGRLLSFQFANFVFSLRVRAAKKYQEETACGAIFHILKWQSVRLKGEGAQPKKYNVKFSPPPFSLCSSPASKRDLYCLTDNLQHTLNKNLVQVIEPQGCPQFSLMN